MTKKKALNVLIEIITKQRFQYLEHNLIIKFFFNFYDTAGNAYERTHQKRKTNELKKYK